jgi:hypothetical protein
MLHIKDGNLKMIKNRMMNKKMIETVPDGL